MSTNIAKLKRGKGAPPPADVAPDVIADDTRPEKVELRPLGKGRARVWLQPRVKEAALSQDVGSIQSAKHVSMIA